MSQSHVATFDRAAQTAHAWLHEISREMNHPGETMAYHALRGVLHALRDRLPVVEAHHLAAQLPVLIRGVYFEGYRPANKPDKFHRDAFFERVGDELQKAGGGNAEAAIHAVLRVMDRHVGAGELDQMWGLLPEDLKRLWPA